MNDKIRFLKEKGKIHTKEDLEFYANATLEEIEAANRLARAEGKKDFRGAGLAGGVIKGA